jgi:hypothetical protein
MHGCLHASREATLEIGPRKMRAPLSRMGEREDLRFGVARRVDFVRAGTAHGPVQALASTRETHALDVGAPPTSGNISDRSNSRGHDA